MKRGAADLNLLVVFEAVLHDRSVSRAASRLGLSQPATSHALNRLRLMLKDRLFVRTPSGMIPTPRAEALAWPIRQALLSLEQILEPETFDPGSAQNRFVVAVNNYAAIVMAPVIAASCARLAPGIRLRIRPSGTLDMLALLDRGDVDLALVSQAAPAERVRKLVLLDDDYVAVTRRDHPIRGRRLSPAMFAAAPALGVSSSEDSFDFIERELSATGHKREVVLDAPFLATGSLITQSDMMAVLARNVARSLARSHAIEMHDLPFRGGRVELLMQWARRLDDQPAHRWLRELVKQDAVKIAAAG